MRSKASLLRPRSPKKCPLCDTGYNWGYFCDDCDSVLVYPTECAICGNAMWQSDAINFAPNYDFSRLYGEYDEPYCETCADKCPWCERYLPRTQFKLFEGEEMCLDCIRATIEERER